MSAQQDLEQAMTLREMGIRRDEPELIEQGNSILAELGARPELQK